ncbi:putative Adenine deaminase (putative) [Pseudozyma hubeiensis]|nr:putative Adenine deaminase (putative) [Pseudozyma hubeiensis]
MTPPPSTSTASSRSSTFTLSLPKIELHAHLNGSIRRSTLSHLAHLRNIDPSTTRILSHIPSTLSEAFDVFRIIHSCVVTLADVERIAYEIGEDMEEDGVVYAEVRSTPRDMGGGEGLEGYVKAVLGGFDRYRSARGKVVLRLLLSIDRAKHTAEDAQGIVSLAAKFRPQGVLGIDLSGDPTRGNFDSYLSALTYARSLGLKITLHAGEVLNPTEFSSMLNFHPDRFGHCCFVDPPNLARLTESRIPIELCLTSNLLSNSIPTGKLTDHHFGLHHKPQSEGSTICCISTDDSGVFGSPLSNEYRLVMDSFGLSEREVFELARRTLDATFLDREGGRHMDEVTRQDREDWKRIQNKFDEFESDWSWE